MNNEVQVRVGDTFRRTSDGKTFIVLELNGPYLKLSRQDKKSLNFWKSIKRFHQQFEYVYKRQMSIDS